MMNDRESAYCSAMIVQSVQQAAWDITHQHSRPSAVFRPELSVDGKQYCALYGKDLQSGIAGFGDSPELAMQDFDINFKKPLRPA